MHKRSVAHQFLFEAHHGDDPGRDGQTGRGGRVARDTGALDLVAIRPGAVAAAHQARLLLRRTSARAHPGDGRREGVLSFFCR